MKNNLKTYAIISLLFNLALLSIYGCFFYQKAAFSEGEVIVPTIETTNKGLKKSNLKLQDIIMEIVQRKPKMQQPFIDLFETNERIANNFKQVKDSLLAMDNHISEKKASLIFEAYNNALFGLQYSYDNGLHKVKKETKLPNNEVVAKIENFNQNTIEGLRIYKRDLKGLSEEELRTSFLTMENHIAIIQLILKWDFRYLAGRRIYFLRYFPLGFTKYGDEISLGQSFQLDVFFGKFVSYCQKRKTSFSIYLNNEEIKIDNEIHSFKLNADSLGKQQVEAVVHWTHLDTKETGQDTTYFEYTVTP